MIIYPIHAYIYNNIPNKQKEMQLVKPVNFQKAHIETWKDLSVV